MSTEDEIEFASLFAASRYGQSAKNDARMKAERRAVMTDKQRSRGGRARSAQMNFRCTTAFKALVAGLSEHMDISAADMFEEAVTSLAKKKGFKGTSDAP